MEKVKTKLLVWTYVIAAFAMLGISGSGVAMGLESFLSPTPALIVAALYMVTLGRYRLRYALFPGLTGMFIGVGIWKTAIFFVAPNAIFFLITTTIARYASSFILGKRSSQSPRFDLGALSRVISNFHPGASQDARDLGTQMAKENQSFNETHLKDTSPNKISEDGISFKEVDYLKSNPSYANSLHHQVEILAEKLNVELSNWIPESQVHDSEKLFRHANVLAYSYGLVSLAELVLKKDFLFTDTFRSFTNNVCEHMVESTTSILPETNSKYEEIKRTFEMQYTFDLTSVLKSVNDSVGNLIAKDPFPDKSLINFLIVKLKLTPNLQKDVIENLQQFNAINFRGVVKEVSELKSKALKSVV